MTTTGTKCLRWVSGIAALALGVTVIALSAPATAAPGDPIGPFNPVRTPLGQLVDGHAANSGFLVFVEGDTTVNADESEGAMATGGDFVIGDGYNVAAGASPIFETFTAPGDAAATYLYVGGGVSFPPNSVNVEIHNGGFAKIGDTSTFSALNVDSNNTPNVPTHIVPPGEAYEFSPRIQLQSSQAPDSVADLAGTTGLIDIPAAFALYRQTATLLGSCVPTIELLSRDAPFDPLPTPIAPGSAGRITLIPGQTNVLNITTDDLQNLSEITYTTPPSNDTPLLVNVSGPSFIGTMPNSAGIGGVQANFILWNFVDATSIAVTGGDTLEGTLYAPYADLNWRVSQNIEGNVIAASFIHGEPLSSDPPIVREVHDFPFIPDISCVEGGTPTPTPTPTPTTTPTPTATATTTLAVWRSFHFSVRFDLIHAHIPVSGKWLCIGKSRFCEFAGFVHDFGVF